MLNEYASAIAGIEQVGLYATHLASEAEAYVFTSQKGTPPRPENVMKRKYPTCPSEGSMAWVKFQKMRRKMERETGIEPATNKWPCRLMEYWWSRGNGPGFPGWASYPGYRPPFGVGVPNFC
jgi:hypothetical protein